MARLTVEVPTVDYTQMYYADILKMLIRYRRNNVPEMTDENEYEPFVQLERAFSLVGHLNSVLLDVVGNESLLPTSKLLESVRNHLKLIGYTLAQASPSMVDVIYELSKVLTATTQFVPQYTQARTEETEDKEAVTFESDASHTIERTDEVSYVFEWFSGLIEVVNNSFEVGDGIVINTANFIYGTHFTTGANITETAQNIAKAINTSENDNIFGKIKAIMFGSSMSLINLDDTTEIVVTKTDGAITNMNVESGAYSSNYASNANVDASPFTPFSGPKSGDCLYVAHKQIQVDKLNFIMNTPSSGIVGVWEYFDGELEDATPEEVTNLGSNLKFDLSTYLPQGEDYTGTIIRVKLQETSAYEDCIVYHESGSGINYIETTDLLGQSSPSVNPEEYVIGSLWQTLPEIEDETLSLTEDGDMSFDLPEDQSQEWLPRTINSLYNGYFMRYRIVSVSTPVSPVIDRIKIDEGAQYLKVETTQGEFKVENPLGSSTQEKDQQFTLTYAPLITGSLVVEVDEGTGFTEWSPRDNFLSSNANAKDYVLEIKADDTAIITFGDGIRGKIPSAGIDNIRCYYRTGADIDGNVGAKTITVNKSGVSFVNRLWNPRQATGWTQKEGSTEEDLARVKIEGPASIRVLDRGITPSDVEYLTTNYKTENGSKVVSRSQVVEETFGVKTLEDIVVGTGGVQLSVAQRNELEYYFNGNKERGIEGKLLANHEVTVTNYSKNLIDVVCNVYGGNKTEIENAIRNFIHPEAKYDDGVTYRWNFSTATTTEYFRVALLYAIIYEVDPVGISNVEIFSPADDIPMGLRELPFANNIIVNIL